ncbi:MAG: hypothetical protein ACRDB1_00860 [Microcoleaceae cyanobacterium]
MRVLTLNICNILLTKVLIFIYADQHTDFAEGLFLTRIEWQLTGFTNQVLVYGNKTVVFA